MTNHSWTRCLWFCQVKQLWPVLLTDVPQFTLLVSADCRIHRSTSHPFLRLPPIPQLSLRKWCRWEKDLVGGKLYTWPSNYQLTGIDQWPCAASHCVTQQECMSHHYLKNVPSVEYRSFVTHIPEQTLIKDQNVCGLWEEFKGSDTYAEVFQGPAEIQWNSVVVIPSALSLSLI